MFLSTAINKNNDSLKMDLENMNQISGNTKKGKKHIKLKICIYLKK